MLEQPGGSGAARGAPCSSQGCSRPPSCPAVVSCRALAVGPSRCLRARPGPSARGAANPAQELPGASSPSARPQPCTVLRGGTPRRRRAPSAPLRAGTGATRGLGTGGPPQTPRGALLRSQGCGAARRGVGAGAARGTSCFSHPRSSLAEPLPAGPVTAEGRGHLAPRRGRT